MSNVIQFEPAKISFIVEVTHLVDDDGVAWMAECDALHLVTEAPTLDALVERVWQIAPEMAMENGLCIPERRLRLSFCA